MERAISGHADAPLAPLLPSRRPLGHLFRFRTEPLDLFAEALAIGDVVRLRTAHVHILALMHPDHADHVLLRHQANYTKATRGYDMLRLVLGNGLLTSEGSTWKRHRRIANPAFHPRCLQGFSEVMVRAAERQVVEWADTNEPVDVHEAMSALTLHVAGECLFGDGFEETTAAIGRALDTILVQVNRLVTTPLPWPQHLPTTGNRAFKEAARTLDTIVADLLAARRASTEEHFDLLEMLLTSHDDDGVGLSDAQLRDEIVTLLLAGHETTANTLAWTLMLLADHPDVADRLRDELRGLGGRAPTMADVPALPYTQQVLHEAMRLYPPAWILGRRAEEDDVVGGYRVPAGTFVYLPIQTIHRHPDIWPDPDRFDPERFAPGADATRHRMAFLPFSAGSRKCIGDRFAMLEATLVLAHLAQHFRFERVQDHPVVQEATVTLRPKHGLRMRVTPL